MKNKFSVIGGGSWATAITKLLSDNGYEVKWWMRGKDTVDYFNEYRHNPKYLSSVDFHGKQVNALNDINQTISDSDYTIIAVPSAYLLGVLDSIDFSILKKTEFISAVKGLIPISNLTIAEHLVQECSVNEEKISVITGPCHAEEVASEKLSYLTFSNVNIKKAENLAKLFTNIHLETRFSTDIIASEYAAVLKNVYALCAGISIGLGYGDNFRAVLISNAMDEMQRFLFALIPEERNILLPSYLGDTIVTAYSPFSRNRTFGIMIGKGYTVSAAKLEMNMIAEGYYATQSITHIANKLSIDLPILKATYDILYKQENPQTAFKLLINKLK